MSHLSPHPQPVRRSLMAATTLSLACVLPAAQSQERSLDVPYVPTPGPVVTRMLEMAEVQPADFVIDLGSGDGRIAIAAVRERGARGAMGVDIDPERIAEARGNAERAGVADKVEFRQQDLFKTDLSRASVLTMYLLPDVNMKLRPRILEDLPPGTRVVSHAFTMEDWEPDATASVDSRSVYLWVVPAKVAGAWKVSSPDGDFAVRFDQRFQKLDGTAEWQGRQVALRDAALRGETIRFTMGEGDQSRTYVGKVDGNGISGYPSDSGGRAWNAARP